MAITLDQLTAYLAAQGVAHEFIAKAHTVHTADASAATGIPLVQITKSLACFGDDKRAYVVIIPGTHKMQFKDVARALGVKSVRLVPFAEAHGYTGYPPGGTPPLCYEKIAGVVVDEALRQFEWIYGGGGTNDQLIKVRTADVIRVNQATVAAVSAAT
jgi:Cys-tRNA(Pro)/Cys-tRNA(Cys) deacylase